MRKTFIILITILTFFANFVQAEEILAPVPESGKMLPQEQSGKQVFIYDKMTISEAESFYKNIFKDDVTKSWQKPKDFSGISINDWGKEKWHNISVVDKGKDGIEIIVMKDSWTWIIGSLVIRFVGVLVILTVLMILINVSGAFFSLKKAKKTEQQA